MPDTGTGNIRKVSPPGPGNNKREYSMKPVPAERLDGVGVTTNELAEALVSWLQEVKEYVEEHEDPRELALLAVELEDLLVFGSAQVSEIKRRVRELNG
jgi:hypothetical protein